LKAATRRVPIAEKTSDAFEAIIISNVRMATLKLQPIRDHSQSFKFSELVIDPTVKEAFIGRDVECDIRISNIEISRRHAKLVKIGDNWTISDLKSTNGVYVNGKQVQPFQQHFLKDGDIIAFGPSDKTEFIYKFTRSNHFGAFSVEMPLATDFVSKTSEKRSKSAVAEAKHSKVAASKNSIASSSKLDTETYKVGEKQGAVAKPELNDVKMSNNEIAAPNSNHKSKRGKALNEKEQLIKKLRLELSKTTKNEEKLKEKALKDGNGNQLANEGASCSGQKVKRKYEDIFESELTCSICHELFIQPVNLNCSHTFCVYCIELWKKNKNSHRECPVCRKPMTSTTRQLVIENLIDKIINEMDEEAKLKRSQVVEERKKLLEQMPSTSADNHSDEESEYEGDSDFDSSSSLNSHTFVSELFEDEAMSSNESDSYETAHSGYAQDGSEVSEQETTNYDESSSINVESDTDSSDYEYSVQVIED
ncbi:E3 ubiquitin-protein ligase RNF8-like protein, partial [Dinothrombium tinctorium]